MKRFSRLTLTAALIAAAEATLMVRADAPAEANPLLRSTESQPAKPAPARAVSPATAAALAAATPPFSLAKTAPPATLPLSDDKPHNGIIRLPQYTVLEPKVRLPSDVQILTPKGKLELAMKQNPGLRIGSFWLFSNNGIALEMLEELLQVERRREAIDLMSLLPTNVRPGDGSGRTVNLVHDAMNPQSSWTRMSTDHAPGQ